MGVLQHSSKATQNKAEFSNFEVIFYLSNSLVPSLDNFTISNSEFERTSTISGRIKLFAIVQSSCVVNHYSLASFGESRPISWRNCFFADTHSYFMFRIE